MSRITLDGPAVTKLASLLQPVDVCDETGRVLGRFTPAIDPEKRKAMEPRVSEDELRRRQQAGGGRTLAEIMVDLEKRA
jgi:hypothetical protein